MVTVDQLVKARRDSIENRKAALDKQYVECRDAMFAGKNIKQNFIEIGSIRYDYNQLEEASKSNKETAIKNAYTLYNRMSSTLQYELGAEVTDDKIRFKWSGKSISFIVEMIAKYFGLKPGMFSFNSSFSTHEAYTEDGYMLHIGADDNDSDIVLIDFGFENLYKSYLQNYWYAL